LAQRAASRVKVVLSGEGADELFGGYTTYLESPIVKAYKLLPLSLRRAVARAAKKKQHFKGKNMLVAAGKSLEESFIGQAFLMNGEEADDILAPEFCGGPDFPQITAEYYQRVSGNDLTKKMYLDMHMWLPHDILLKADKMTMAHSLELRVPFLDRKVWESARQLPARYRVRGKTAKFIFRKVAADRIPQAWATRKKIGFPVPFSLWLKEETYYSKVRAAFSEALCATFFDQEKILALLEEHHKGTKNNGRKIYTIYAFLIWYKRYFNA
jgi:asparagine synthase (glutamine-hydrolysing)